MPRTRNLVSVALIVALTCAATLATTQPAYAGGQRAKPPTAKAGAKRPSKIHRRSSRGGKRGSMRGSNRSTDTIIPRPPKKSPASGTRTRAKPQRDPLPISRRGKRSR